jgi:hypothetical protein
MGFMSWSHNTVKRNTVKLCSGAYERPWAEPRG